MKPLGNSRVNPESRRNLIAHSETDRLYTGVPRDESIESIESIRHYSSDMGPAEASRLVALPYTSSASLISRVTQHQHADARTPGETDCMSLASVC